MEKIINLLYECIDKDLWFEINTENSVKLRDYINSMQQENTNLKQALNEIREICNYYGIIPEENDDAILRHILKDILQIIDKVLGDE